MSHCEMDEDLARRELMTGYLLGELSEGEQCRVEETFFTDPAFLGELLATRDDLIDAFVQRELGATENEQFERRLRSSPALLEKVEFARGLLLAVNSSATAQVEKVVAGSTGRAGSRRDRPGRPAYARMWPQMCGLLAISLSIVAGFLQSRGPTRPPSSAPDTRQMDAGQTNAGQIKITPPLPTATTPRTSRVAKTPAVVAGFLLSPGMSRAGVELRRLTIPAQAGTVRLQLEIEDEAQRRYRAVLQTHEGRQLWIKDRVAPVRVHSSRVVVCDLPSSLLENTNYVLRLHPQPEEGVFTIDYYFSVTRF